MCTCTVYVAVCVCVVCVSVLFLSMESTCQSQLRPLGLVFESNHLIPREGAESRGSCEESLLSQIL